MLHKDDDFEQVGELLNVWLFGHEVELAEASPGSRVHDEYTGTRTTFSEFMSARHRMLAGEGIRVNRLAVRETDVGGRRIGCVIGDEPRAFPPPVDPNQAVPNLPAGVRLLDAFVCDGPGAGAMAAEPLGNARRFSGRLTPGLVNVNTAPLEVLRALPHLYRLTRMGGPASGDPRSALAGAIVQDREAFGPNDDAALGLSMPIGGPDYATRSDPDHGIRQGPGLASIGEIALLTQPADGGPVTDTTGEVIAPDAWRADFAALDPFGHGTADLSTDVHEAPGGPDAVGGDVEEANLLLAGLSNLVTTRSDVFTVHFRVRSFRQHPETGVWNALDREQIVDDRRYVMLVDRSRVERPTDKPRVLYLERVE